MRDLSDDAVTEFLTLGENERTYLRLVLDRSGKKGKRRGRGGGGDSVDQAANPVQ